MRTAKSLIVIVVALTLSACAVYVHDYPDRRRPCAHDVHADGQHRLGVIGISIGRAGESHRGPLVVERVVSGSPAADADILPGDRIRAIDGESTRGMTVSEAARLIRGRADTAVELRIESRRGARLVTLVRVPPRAIWGERGSWREGRPPCEEGEPEPAYQAPAAPAPEPPASDDSLAPEIWPPTKPGHHAP